MKQELTLDEKITLCKRLVKYSPAYPCMKIDYYWTRFWMSGTCGYFKPSKSIYLSSKDKLAILDGNADDVICHELYHAMQYETQGAARYAIRNLTKLNEPEAYAEQERVRAMKEGAG